MLCHFATTLEISKELKEARHKRDANPSAAILDASRLALTHSRSCCPGVRFLPIGKVWILPLTAHDLHAARSGDALRAWDR